MKIKKLLVAIFALLLVMGLSMMPAQAKTREFMPYQAITYDKPNSWEKTTGISAVVSITPGAYGGGACSYTSARIQEATDNSGNWTDLNASYIEIGWTKGWTCSDGTSRYLYWADRRKTCGNCYFEHAVWDFNSPVYDNATRQITLVQEAGDTYGAWLANDRVGLSTSNPHSPNGDKWWNAGLEASTALNHMAVTSLNNLQRRDEAGTPGWFNGWVNFYYVFTRNDPPTVGYWQFTYTKWVFSIN